ncbi:hypothetical protein [Epilithonimonas hungarica]|uniref:hypothetical protein n=1 Tax=Epilithonimonas hungarica TaxID=454006 RepID=UPI00158727D1|nr:hypothetical protein [Epilithonimonas hungarica]
MLIDLFKTKSLSEIRKAFVNYLFSQYHKHTFLQLLIVVVVEIVVVVVKFIIVL